MFSMTHVGFNYKHTFIILFIAFFIIVNFISTSYELKNPIDGKALQKRQNDEKAPKKVVDPSSTCTTSDDARCKSPPGVPPKVETYVELGIETMKPTLIPGENNSNNNTTNLITTTTTLTLYFAGYITTITTKNSNGDPTTFATSVLPSTLLVIKTVVVTSPTSEKLDKTMDVSDSTTNLHDFNRHGLWGVTMSLALIVTTLIFMVFA
ncbi:uncharacterized protein OCT59_022414 [Rhizophagus irregularis]|uniref:Uncharacterized protein n=4 Tax=Rhizophagus irregularis TaxID=588596 RepID=U9UME6_RHIID|nr:hypothetical protein GLOIN_2v1647499 [Rhizophagus irregularis DAOM 181602=DAOM 197198]PKY20554.1 hypothetical protein RhiirB3_469839 [Rhizophagus irregularis]POG67403.1 hypothetical protein GLOIN_2v1647499 [Rhizophagus irregularis DAOM 181602=DAOM 197198]UZO28909.1 hypothetical protein OCT59_022414 [Rhizophagus irregularis]|eukprot:XP_025174269.1 hypothetical protein GLOIN_2v1647499 [Rhizophagus irregularis DAOM 181602=DAOM 197198]